MEKSTFAKQRESRKNESVSHLILKNRAITWLREKGYKVFTEYRIRIGTRMFYVDVVGFKGSKSIAIECGHTTFAKVEVLKTQFNEVIKFTYTSKVYPKNVRLKESRISATEALSTVFQRGKSQVPLVIRDLLGISDGSKIVWKLKDGEIFVEVA